MLGVLPAPATATGAGSGIGGDFRLVSHAQLWDDSQAARLKWPTVFHRSPLHTAGEDMRLLFFMHYTLATNVTLRFRSKDKTRWLLARDPRNGGRGDRASIDDKKGSFTTIGIMRGGEGAWAFPISGNSLNGEEQEFKLMHWATRNTSLWEL